MSAAIIAREVETAFAQTDEQTQVRAFLAQVRIAAPAAGDERAKARILRLLVRAGSSPGTGFRIFGNWQADDAEPAESEAAATERTRRTPAGGGRPMMRHAVSFAGVRDRSAIRRRAPGHGKRLY